MRAVCIHHTYRPSEEQWVRHGGWPYWGPVLARFYRSRGWVAMPHVFAAPDGWHVLWPLDRDGRGVGGGALERGLRHVEIVGDYRQRLPSGATLNHALDAVATLLLRGGLIPSDETLTHHTAVVGPGRTECPGAMLMDNWRWFTDLVANEWWRKKMDALEAAVAARFEQEEITRLLEGAKAKRAQSENLIIEAERAEAMALTRLQRAVNTRHGLAYLPEVLLGGDKPVNWEA